MLIWEVIYLFLSRKYLKANAFGSIPAPLNMFNFMKVKAKKNCVKTSLCARK